LASASRISSPQWRQAPIAWNFLTKPRGDRKWDLFLRAGAIVALIGIPVAAFIPGTVPLVWLAVVAIPANSPLSPILPTAFEPLIMEAAKYSGVLPVTLTALGAYLYMEYLNWHVYAWVLNWEKFSGLRDHRWVRWGVEHFSRAPATTILIFAVTPLPFWIVRSLGILHRYPIRRFMGLTAVGRFPRLFLYAWVGATIHVPTVILLSVALGTGAAIVAWRLFRGQRILQDTVLDTANDAPTELPTSAPLLTRDRVPSGSVS
jgi:hypothetical protein